MVADLEDYEEVDSPGSSPTPGETARLRIDKPRQDDLADIVHLANDRCIATMLATMPHPFAIDDARQLIARAQYNGAERATFAIRLKATGRFIGSAGFGTLEHRAGVQIGYWVGEPFQRQGFATEAVQALVDHIFQKTPIAKLQAMVRVINPASRRVLVKSGFQYRDQCMLHSRGAGGAVSAERFYLERSTWLALKRWGKAS